MSHLFHGLRLVNGKVAIQRIFFAPIANFSTVLGVPKIHSPFDNPPRLLKASKFNPSSAALFSDKKVNDVENFENLKQEISEDKKDEQVDSKPPVVDPSVAYDALLQEFDDLKDKYHRALAETENVRRRGQKQVEDAKIYAVQGFCKDLLEVADILELAISSVKLDDAEKTEEVKGVLEGITMTKTVLLKTFEKHGLKKIDPEGEKFNPNLHEAVFEIPKEQTKYEPGQIGVVMKIGYSLHGRPIRPAQVGVVKS